MNDRDLTDFLLERGALTPDRVEEAQRAAEGRPIADVLVERGWVTRRQLDDAVARLSAPARFCAACNADIAVPDGEGQCPWCAGALTRRSQVPVRPREDIEGIMELTKEELPPEVRVLRGVPGRHFGKYILLEELGRGGTGMVQKAWDTIMGEYVALKFIKEAAGTKTGDTSSFRKRQDQVLALLQEARAAARLYHPNILPIRDLGLVGGTVYLSMDYIEGTTLHQAIKSAQDRKRLSCLYEDPVFHMGIVRSVAEALHYAHTSARPLVHCDLKPSNILVSVAGTPYVMDFGLARLLDLPAEYEAVARGTPSYMAPEQIVGKDLSVRTDVYGLGTILYELVCGRPPFVGRDAEDIAMKTMYDAPKRPTEAFRLDDESRRGPTMAILEMVTLIESVCLRCMAKDPAMRYGTALEVADEIETVLEVLESRDLSRQLGLDRR